MPAGWPGCAPGRPRMRDSLRVVGMHTHRAGPRPVHDPGGDEMKTLPMIPTQGSLPDLTVDEIAELHAEVRALADDRNATILAHNYQVPEVQDVPDYVGDSLGLSRQAAASDVETIVFC